MWAINKLIVSFIVGQKYINYQDRTNIFLIFSNIFSYFCKISNKHTIIDMKITTKLLAIAALALAGCCNDQVSFTDYVDTKIGNLQWLGIDSVNVLQDIEFTVDGDRIWNKFQVSNVGILIPEGNRRYRINRHLTVIDLREGKEKRVGTEIFDGNLFSINQMCILLKVRCSNVIDIILLVLHRFRLEVHYTFTPFSEPLVTDHVITRSTSSCHYLTLVG